MAKICKIVQCSSLWAMKSYSGSTVVSVFVVAVRSISRANTNGLVATYYCKEIEMKYYTDKRHSHTHSQTRILKTYTMTTEAAIAHDCTKLEQLNKMHME